VRARSTEFWRFFSSVEGLFALNESEAIEGLFVSTEPCLRLVRAEVEQAATETPAVAIG